MFSSNLVVTHPRHSGAYQPFAELTQDQRLLRARIHARQSERVQEVLAEQAEKAASRRFSDEPLTGFGAL